MKPKLYSLPKLFVTKYSVLHFIRGDIVYVPYYYIDSNDNIYFVIKANDTTIGYISKASPYVYLPPAPLYMVVDYYGEEE